MEKRKHRFNIIDVVAILLVAAAVAFAVWHFTRGGGAKGNVRVTFVMQTLEDRIEDMIPEESERFSGGVAVGDAVFDADTGAVIGTVTDCDSRQAQFTAVAANGVEVKTPVDGYRTLTVTCEADGVAGDGSFKVGGVVITAGKVYTLMFPNLWCRAECILAEAPSGK